MKVKYYYQIDYISDWRNYSIMLDERNPTEAAIQMFNQFVQNNKESGETASLILDTAKDLDSRIEPSGDGNREFYVHYMYWGIRYSFRMTESCLLEVGGLRYKLSLHGS